MIFMSSVVLLQPPPPTISNRARDPDSGKVMDDISDRDSNAFWSGYTARAAQSICSSVIWRCCNSRQAKHLGPWSTSGIQVRMYIYIYMYVCMCTLEVVATILKNSGPVLVMVKPFLKNVEPRKPTYKKWGGWLPGYISIWPNHNISPTQISLK